MSQYFKGWQWNKDKYLHLRIDFNQKPKVAKIIVKTSTIAKSKRFQIKQSLGYKLGLD